NIFGSPPPLEVQNRTIETDDIFAEERPVQNLCRGASERLTQSDQPVDNPSRPCADVQLMAQKASIRRRRDCMLMPMLHHLWSGALIQLFQVDHYEVTPNPHG